MTPEKEGAVCPHQVLCSVGSAAPGREGGGKWREGKGMDGGDAGIVKGADVMEEERMVGGRCGG